MTTLKLVLFDIDGTLLLTGGVGRDAFEKVFKDLFGITGAWGDVIPDGKTDPIIRFHDREHLLGQTENTLRSRDFHRTCLLLQYRVTDRSDRSATRVSHRLPAHRAKPLVYQRHSPISKKP